MRLLLKPLEMIPEPEMNKLKLIHGLMYIPHVVKNDPTEIVIFEKYKDKEAFKAHGNSAYFKEAAQKFEDLLEGKIQVKFLEEV